MDASKAPAADPRSPRLSAINALWMPISASSQRADCTRPSRTARMVAWASPSFAPASSSLPCSRNATPPSSSAWASRIAARSAAVRLLATAASSCPLTLSRLISWDKGGVINPPRISSVSNCSATGGTLAASAAIAASC